MPWARFRRLVDRCLPRGRVLTLYPFQYRSEVETSGSTDIRINALRHDSRQDPYAVVIPRISQEASSLRRAILSFPHSTPVRPHLAAWAALRRQPRMWPDMPLP